MSYCVNRGCRKPPYNGQTGQCCSKSCLALAPNNPQCPVCGEKPPYNGQVGKCCSHTCKKVATGKLCPTCRANPPYKNEGKYCSILCRDQAAALASSIALANSPALASSTTFASSPVMCPMCGLKASKDNVPGEYCSNACRYSIAQSLQLIDFFITIPWLLVQGPIIGFYCPGSQKRSKVDDWFKTPWLGNMFQWDVLFDGNMFQNGEAAFQSTKFSGSLALFLNITGEAAYGLKKSLKNVDWTYGGYGSNWKAMLAVLFCKFSDPILQRQLIATEKAVLIEHNDLVGRDETWSNNHNGHGQNWLGLQLMLVRDQLSGNDQFTRWVKQSVNISTGKSYATVTPWNKLVFDATSKLLAHNL